MASVGELEIAATISLLVFVALKTVALEAPTSSAPFALTRNWMAPVDEAKVKTSETPEPTTERRDKGVVVPMPTCRSIE